MMKGWSHNIRTTAAVATIFAGPAAERRARTYYEGLTGRADEIFEGCLLQCMSPVLAGRILKTEAPRRAALVRKPLRSEWPLKSTASSPRPLWWLMHHPSAELAL